MSRTLDPSHRPAAFGAALALFLAGAPAARAQAPTPPAGGAGHRPAAPAAAAPRDKPAKPPATRPAAVVKVPLARAVTALAGDDAGAAANAARSLGLQKGAAAVAALLDALALGLAPEVAAAALEALGAIGDARALDALLVYRDHRDPRVRAAAVAALGELSEPRAEKAVVAALFDGHVAVRAAAARVAGARKLRRTAPALLALLKGGDAAAAAPLAVFADPALTKQIADLIGQAPDAAVASCLGAILLRGDHGSEEARVEVVRALGRLPGEVSLEHLSAYVASVPATPPRQSRREAEALMESKLGGGS